MALRITRDDETSTRTTLWLEGHLVGEWAALVELECASLRRSSREVGLDLSGVTFVDPAAVEVLARLGHAGVEIFGCNDSVGSVLEGEGVPITRSLRSARGWRSLQ